MYASPVRCLPPFPCLTPAWPLPLHCLPEDFQPFSNPAFSPLLMPLRKVSVSPSSYTCLCEDIANILIRSLPLPAFLFLPGLYEAASLYNPSLPLLAFPVSPLPLSSFMPASPCYNIPLQSCHLHPVSPLLYCFWEAACRFHDGIISSFLLHFCFITASGELAVSC